MIINRIHYSLYDKRDCYQFKVVKQIECDEYFWCFDLLAKTIVQCRYYLKLDDIQTISNATICFGIIGLPEIITNKSRHMLHIIRWLIHINTNDNKKSMFLPFAYEHEPNDHSRPRKKSGVKKKCWKSITSTIHTFSRLINYYLN